MRLSELLTPLSEASTKSRDKVDTSVFVRSTVTFVPSASCKIASAAAAPAFPAKSE